MAYSYMDHDTSNKPKTTLKTICFITRRYDDSGFWNKNQSFYNEVYNWVSHMQEYRAKAIYLIGADQNKVVENHLGKFYFIKDATRKSPLHYSKRFFQQCVSIIKQENVDVIHGHGIQDILSFVRIWNMAGRNAKLFLQDHASKCKLRYYLYKNWFKKVDGIFFNSPDQELEWTEAKLFDSSKVYFAPEGVIKDSILGKRKKSFGFPTLIWVGNLNMNKDPLTIIKAIKTTTTKYPNIIMKMIYREVDLLPSVKSLISDLDLENNIELIGEIPHEKVFDYYLTHDYFILGSKKEGSGYAALEAMACGTVPILSNIPSFKDFTNNSTIGCVFEQGNVDSLSQAMNVLFNKDVNTEREKLKMWYQTEFSPQAKARKHIEAYFGKLNDLN